MHPGLSPDQAPPFSVPLRFFQTAPLFLAAAGLLAAWPGADWQGLTWAASRWTPRAMALTHLVALGYLGLVMLGALSQILPVVAGSPLPASLAVSRWSHASLALGIPLLSVGMLTLSGPWLVTGAALAGLGLALFGAAAAVVLVRAPPSPTVWAMRLAVACLLPLWLLGSWLVSTLAGLARVPDLEALVTLHGTLGLLGWVGLLVVGVAYQVVPMLQLTPSYPASLTRSLTWTLFGLLVAGVVETWLGWPAAWLETAWVAGIAGLLLTFAVATLRLQHRRRRKLRDPTLDYWRLAMLSLTLSCVLGVALHLWPQSLAGPWQVLTGLTFLLGFAVGTVNGMLFKIVPFLAWFHLNAQVGIRRTRLLSMKDFIADSAARRQYRLHLGALAFLLPSPWWAGLALPGGLLLSASALHMGWLIWRASRILLAEGGTLSPSVPS